MDEKSDEKSDEKKNWKLGMLDIISKLKVEYEDGKITISNKKGILHNIDFPANIIKRPIILMIFLLIGLLLLYHTTKMVI